VTTSNGEEMMSSSSLIYQTTNTNWNPIITTPTKMSVIQENPPSPVTVPSTCWDWLLYSPDIYSHLYVPLSSFPHQQEEKDDDNLDLLASLPTWLLALLYPSTKQIHTIDNENESDQEINSLPNNHDEALLSMNIEKKLTNVSSNLSSENSLHGLKSEQNRSSTPDTDDGYQSASDASRSDYSQQSSLHSDHPNSKDDRTMNVPSSLMPRRISYAAAAVKPATTPLLNNTKISSVSTAINKSKNNSSLLTTNDGQKLKFTAPRFERMHHAKQYSTTSSSSPSSTTLLTNRTQIRSNNNNNNQRSVIINSSRRR
jgi:hypothetical protein